MSNILENSSVTIPELDEFNSPEMEEKKKKYLKNMEVTKEDVITVMNIPQRTPEWIKWRSCRMTASNYGSATGHNPKNKPRALLDNLLWGTFKGNMATEYGTKNEPVAVKVYEQFMEKYIAQQNPQDKISFFYPGLIICQKHPWLAVSPDGLPCLRMNSPNSNPKTIRFLLEIKCPFYKKLYPHIPHYYYDQIQGIMAILQLPYCDFVVWTPEKTQIRRYNFDLSYWEKVLFPRLKQFYMDEYLPRLILKEEGKLKSGELEPTLAINLSTHLSSVSSKDEPFEFIWGDDNEMKNNDNNDNKSTKTKKQKTDNTVEQV
jgi:putative phage-type endonuclease